MGCSAVGGGDDRVVDGLPLLYRENCDASSPRADIEEQTYNHISPQAMFVSSSPQWKLNTRKFKIRGSPRVGRPPSCVPSIKIAPIPATTGKLIATWPPPLTDNSATTAPDASRTSS